ncbi:hypothetical protein DRA42_00530 [Ethanoligenens harbinense]|nr:hypothetical protein CXQ68_00520 [Ethanoligenens harbinense YUAN-3]QCN91113.1 hypothetical protein DRA42_00530 [Ethanoligenens harbinense]
MRIRNSLPIPHKHPFPRVDVFARVCSSTIFTLWLPHFGHVMWNSPLLFLFDFTINYFFGKGGFKKMGFDGSINIDSSIDGTGFSKGIEKLGGVAKASLGAITGLISGAATALGGAAAEGIKYNNQMEQYQTSFAVMLGSAAKAQEMINNLQNFSMKTPFQMANLADATKTLMGYGISVQDIMPDLEMLGDVSQGNSQKLQNLALVFGQVQAAGKLQGQDLLQLIDNGFNPLQTISQQTGKSMAELRTEMENGQISAQDVTNAFKSATSAGGLFYNDLEEQSKTFNGQLSTLKDHVLIFLGSITGALTNSLKDTALPMVNGWLEQLQSAFNAGGVNGVVGAFGNVLSQAVNAVAAQAPQLISLAVMLTTTLLNGLNANAGQLASSGASVVTGLAKGIISVAQSLGAVGINLIQNIIEGITSSLPSIAVSAVQVATRIVEALLNALPSVVTAAWALTAGVAQGLTSALPTLIMTIVQIIPQIINAIAVQMPALMAALTAMIPQVINALSTALVTGIPLILQAAIQLLMAIVQAIPQIIVAVVTALPTLIQSIVTTLVQALPILITGAVQLLMAIVQAIPQILPPLIAAIPQIITTLITGLVQALPELINGAVQLLMAIIDAIPIIIQTLIPMIPEIVHAIVDALIRAMPVLIEGSIELFFAILKAIPMIVVELIKDMPQIIQAILQGLAAGGGELKNAGGDLIRGLWQGIQDVSGWLWNKVSGFFGTLTDKIKNFFGIHSPSRLMRDEIGKMLPPGIALGFEASMPDAISDMQAEMDAMTAKMQASVAAQQSAVFVGTSGTGAQTIDNSVTKSPIININGPVNVTDQGNQRQTLQQLQFLAAI